MGMKIEYIVNMTDIYVAQVIIKQLQDHLDNDGRSFILGSELSVFIAEAKVGKNEQN